MKNIIIALLFLVSCTPQKKLQRLIEKHPELIHTLDTQFTIHDTIIKKDTILVEGMTVVAPFNIDSLTRKYTDIYEDSFVSISLSLDSLKQLKTKVKVKDRLITRTDTIYYTKEITVPAKVVVHENKWWMWAFIISWAVILALTSLYWRK